MVKMCLRSRKIKLKLSAERSAFHNVKEYQCFLMLVDVLPSSLRMILMVQLRSLCSTNYADMLARHKLLKLIERRSCIQSEFNFDVCGEREGI